MNGGRILDVTLTGRLAKPDYDALLAAFERNIAQYGKMRVLVDMTRFHGWDAGALWEDIKLDIRYMNHMERLAVIGEKRWQQAITSFARDMLPMDTRYFMAAEAAQARKWIAEP